MDLMLLRTFQRQVLLQCQFMLTAADHLNQSLRTEQRDAGGVFYAVQNLLNAAANISKALWGQSGNRAAQRQPLRDSIGVTDTSPLRDVVMRNNFEHIDERIDQWWRDSQRHNLVDFLIGPPESMVGIDEIDMLRCFDPGTTDVVFWGQRFNLQVLIDEVGRILPALRAEAAKPHWIP